MPGENPPADARDSRTHQAAHPCTAHVLHVLQPQTGGVPAYVAALAMGLAGAGLQVSVACAAGASIAVALREHGIETLELELTRAPHPAKDAVAVAAIARFCRERGVGLLHGHSTKAGLLVALAGARTGIPSVYTPNGWSFEQHVRPPVRAAYAAYERRLVRHYHAAVIAVSHSGRAAAQRWRVASPEAVRVIPTGLPPLSAVARAVARERLGVGPGDVVAVWVGRAAAQKRPGDLVPIARRLAGHVTVVALCAGAAGSELEGALREAGVHLADAECEPAVLYGAADMMLQTSAWEAAPLAVLEGMASGLPIVAYDVGGVGEQVASGRTGYLVAPGDVEMLCECALALAQRPQARAAMGAAGARRVQAIFSYPDMIRQFLATYGELVGDARPVPAAIAPARAPLLDVNSTREVVLA